MLMDGHRPEFLAGSGKLACRFKSLPLIPQNYFITVSVGEGNSDDAVIKSLQVSRFTVEADLVEYGFKGDFRKFSPQSTSVVVPYEWHLPDGTVATVSLADPHK
jgi:hypothetical protein